MSSAQREQGRGLPVSWRSSTVLAVVKAALLAGMVLLSLLWWRSDADLCLCEYCPDGYCSYGEQIHAALTSRAPGAWPRLLESGRHFLHAHSPLAPTLQALVMLAGLGPVLAFVLINLAATALSWLAIRRTVARASPPRADVLLMLFVAFCSNAIVIRSVARPVTDAVGMTCTIWTLVALGRHLEARDRRSAARLLVLQILGLASRVSFIPMLAMPALAELVEPTGGRPLRARVAAAARAAATFGLLPAVLFFGTARALGLEHVRAAWAWAHDARYVSTDPLGDFVSSSVLAGGIYLILGLCFAGRTIVRERTLRIHLAWVLLYSAFLGAGRGALWPRYFLPVVPSIMIVTTPALVALARSRIVVAWGMVALLALWGLHSIQPLVTNAPRSLSLLGSDFLEAGARDAHPSDVRLGASARAKLAVSASQSAADAALMIDGRRDTAWSSGAPLLPGVAITIALDKPRRVTSILLPGPPLTPLRGLVVQGSRDGRTWDPLDARVEGSGFFAERPGVVLRLPGTRVRALRIVANVVRTKPWVVDELEIRVARRGDSHRRAIPGSDETVAPR